MRDGYVDDFDLKRIITAIEEDLEVKPLEEPRVVVKNNSKEDPTGHVVNLAEMVCTCKDYEYNCLSEEKQANDRKYCKHIYRVVFEKQRML